MFALFNVQPHMSLSSSWFFGYRKTKFPRILRFFWPLTYVRRGLFWGIISLARRWDATDSPFRLRLQCSPVWNLSASTRIISRFLGAIWRRHEEGCVLVIWMNCSSASKKQSKYWPDCIRNLAAPVIDVCRGKSNTSMHQVLFPSKKSWIWLY